MTITAVLFDMDGVLLDSERHWGPELDIFFSQLVPWTPADKERTTGIGLFGIYHYLVDRYGLAMPLDVFTERCDAIAFRVYAKTSLSLHAKECLTELKAAGIKVALGTSGHKTWWMVGLAGKGVEVLFDAIVGADEVNGKTKPAPDIYRKAAEKLGAQPGECLVVEDAEMGVISAKAAGMRCLGYRTDVNVMQDLSAADREITDLAEIPLLISSF